MTTTPAQKPRVVTGMAHLATSNEEILLRTTGIKKYFPVSRGGALFGGKANLKAVDDVSFDIRSGETFGLVGESGCGKTTTAKLVLGLEKPTGGDISFEGKSV